MTKRIPQAEADVMREMNSRGAHLSVVDQGSLLDEREEMVERLEDFMDYFDPRGGVSDVPRGPFDRAREFLTESPGSGGPAKLADVSNGLADEQREQEGG
jgi:hypothetical protein